VGDVTFNGQSHDSATVDELVTYLRSQFDTHAGEDVDRLGTQLHHSHLPKLENHGILEYDDRSETIRYRGERGIEWFVACAKFVETPVYAGTTLSLLSVLPAPRNIELITMKINHLDFNIFFLQ
jgi:hypothetical protein